MARGPRVDVPGWDDFNALADRVSRLEGKVADHESRITTLESDVIVDPEPLPPEPEPVPPGEGVQAKRVADAIESFGVNTFSSLEANANLWGSWPSDYSPGSVIDALTWLTGGSGFSFRIREYHYASRAVMQREWIRQIMAALPDTRVSMCPGANATVEDAHSLTSFDVAWVEGLNEPNTDFGSGQIAYNETVAIQHAVLAAPTIVMGPSIVAGMPHPEGWIEQYCGGPENLRALNELMQIGNGHLYPPDHTDAAGTSMAEYIGGLWTAYAGHPIALTEYHPTLFNGHGRAPGQPDWSGDRDAFYALTGLFRSVKCTTVGLWWYALFDYGSTYLCGLFPQGHADNPRPAAVALRNLCRACADREGDARSFTPGSLAFTLDAPADVEWDLWQSSDGTFFVVLWRSAREPGGEAVPVTLRFAETPAQVNLYDPCRSAEPVEGWTHPTAVTLSMPAAAWVLSVAGG